MYGWKRQVGVNYLSLAWCGVCVSPTQVLLQDDDQRGDVLGRRVRAERLGLRTRVRVGPAHGASSHAAGGGPPRRQLSTASPVPAAPGHLGDRLRCQAVGADTARAQLQRGDGRGGTMRMLCSDVILCHNISCIVGFSIICVIKLY